MNIFGFVRFGFARFATFRFVILGFIGFIGFAIFAYADNINDDATQKSADTGKTIDELLKLESQCRNDETLPNGKEACDEKDEAFQKLERGCEADEAQACFELGAFWAQSHKVYGFEISRGSMQFELVEKYHSKACYFGLQKACEAQDDFYEKAFINDCKNNMGCGKLGVFYYYKGDYDKARGYLEGDCDLESDIDENESCYVLGTMFALGLGVPKNLSKAELAWDKVCNDDSYAREEDYCWEVVDIYKKGDEKMGIAPNSPKYIHYADKLCHIHIEGGLNNCDDLAKIYENGDKSLGIAKDSQKSLYYYGMLCDTYDYDEIFCDKVNPTREKLCAQSDGKSCYQLYKFYDNYDGEIHSKKDATKKAQRFLQKACDLEFGDACLSIARDYFERRDYDNAEAYSSKGCSYKYLKNYDKYVACQSDNCDEKYAKDYDEYKGCVNRWKVEIWSAKKKVGVNK